MNMYKKRPDKRKTTWTVLTNSFYKKQTFYLRLVILQFFISSWGTPNNNEIKKFVIIYPLLQILRILNCITYSNYF